MKIRLWSLLPAAVAALTVAGCSSGSGLAKAGASAPPPAAVRTEMIAAMKKAVNVHVKGSVQQAGQNLTLDMSFTAPGEIAGTMSSGSASFYVLTIGQRTYFKVTSDFLKYVKLPASVCKEVCNRYLVVPASDSKSIVGNLSLGSLISTLTKDVPRLRYSGPDTVNGQRAWRMHGSDGSTVYVTARGTRYPLRLIPPSPSKGQLDFTRWNSVTIPPAPPASQLVNMSQLSGS